MGLKICIACSAGGHLHEILQIEDAYKNYEYFYLTFKKVNSIELAKRRKVYFITDPKRNPIKFIKNFFETLSIIIKERPNVVISNGAGVAINACVISKLLGARILFIESFCRVRKKSLSARILYLIADVFLVQWKNMVNIYGKKAKYAGSVF